MAKKVVFVKVIHHKKVILIIVKVFKCDGKIVVIKQIVVVKKKFDGKPYGHMPYEQMPADPPSKG